MIRTIRNSDIIVASRPNGGFAIEAGIGRHRRHILLTSAEAAELAAELTELTSPRIQRFVGGVEQF
ncbi:hypothetical protein A5707_11355 [Mycobacterium kyorinense]|uniref:Uncharacterized protein n=1 Tax=Mycobacterium kyorinense TaxID=487514 RepID=A0A1A2ZVG8_9MYCO|nr:hypothetical protein [Mycobacterium kyorinense]OBI53462.1 hypothetical protein A5707_11355 [Mycobacterium kyorinense]